MKVYLAADHAGFALKEELLQYVATLGHEILDLGALSFDADDDYPDVVTPLASQLASEPEARGIVCAGSGQGEAMCANRIPGVRAAVFYGPQAAITLLEQEGTASTDTFDIIRLTREHNDANLLSVGSRFVSPEVAKEAVRLFLETSFSGEKRHLRRIAKF